MQGVRYPADATHRCYPSRDEASSNAHVVTQSLGICINLVSSSCVAFGVAIGSGLGLYSGLGLGPLMVMQPQHGHDLLAAPALAPCTALRVGSGLGLELGLGYQYRALTPPE